MKSGRPSKYETDVKPRFNEITEWLQIGATDKEIAENLGINKATLCDYKKRYSEFNELIKNGRKQPVQAIKAALFKRATGFEYTEVRHSTKVNADGTTETKDETITRYVVPDPASAMILLKHWDKDHGWTNDPQQLELKKQELELKKKHLESEVW